MSVTGRIHSFETFATIDGPGIRFLLFMQGCPLRCVFCHNPDSWKMSDGMVMSADDVMAEIRKYRTFMDTSHGGVTVSGGEPLVQKEFVTELFRQCRSDALHTALDTSGYIKGPMPIDLLEYTDLVLLDLKCIDESIHPDLTGVDIEPIKKFAEYLSDTGKKIWVRHVLIPGITDNDELLERLAAYIRTLKTVELVEILPFHKMGEYKWSSLGYPYRLKDTPVPTRERIDNAIEIFRRYDLKVR